MIKLTIDDREIEVPEGTSVLNAAKTAGIDIPTLCFLENVHSEGICRMCLVEVDGRPNLLASCVLKAANGMKIKTYTPKILRSRKTALELILSRHVQDCLRCERNVNCELQALAGQLGVDSFRFSEDIKDRIIDDSSY